MQKYRKNVNTIILLALGAMIICVTALYFVKLFQAIKYSYPGEIRGAANVFWADAISRGIDIYSLNNQPELYAKYTTVYSGFSLVISGLISRIINTDLIKTIYTFQIVTLLLTALINAYATYRIKKNKYCLLLSLAVFMNNLTVFMYASGKPGQLAVMLVCLAYLLCDIDKYPIIQALLIVGACWDKQYFIVCAVPILAKYIIDKKWKSAIWYSSIGLAVGGGSVLFVLLKYPLYFIYTFISRSVDEGFADHSMAEHIHYTCAQMINVFKNYWYFAILAFVGLCLCSVLKKVDIYQVELVFMTLFLLCLGMDFGNFMVYHYELLVPSLLVCGARSLIRILEKCKEDEKQRDLKGALYVLFVLMCVGCSYHAMSMTKVLSNVEANNYEELYEYIGNLDGKIFLGSAVALYSLDHNGDYVVNNGLSDYFTEMRHGGITLGKKGESKLVHRLLPCAEDIIKKSEQYEINRKTALENEEFAAIFFMRGIDDNDIDPEGVMNLYYHKVDSFDLVNTANQRFTVECWMPNTKKNLSN